MTFKTMNAEKIRKYNKSDVPSAKIRPNNPKFPIKINNKKEIDERLALHLCRTSLNCIKKLNTKYKAHSPLTKKIYHQGIYSTIPIIDDEKMANNTNKCDFVIGLNTIFSSLVISTNYHTQDRQKLQQTQTLQKIRRLLWQKLDHEKELSQKKLRTQQLRLNK